MQVKSVDIEWDTAISWLPDIEAVKRGYFDKNCLSIANEIASEIVEMPWVNQEGYLSDVGSPHQWWCDNLPSYKKYSSWIDDQKQATRKWANICQVAQKAVDLYFT